MDPCGPRVSTLKRFQRFRRDDVGVFELKGMIEKNTERVAAAEQVASDNSDVL